MADAALEEIAKLADRQEWPLPARLRAYQWVTAPTDRGTWGLYLDHNLLAGGSLSLLAGCVFFVAANWSSFGAYAKFLLVDGLILGTALYAYRSGLDQLRSRWALTVSCGLVGAMLALYGQVYQSGADPYTMFLGWAALTLPWTLRMSFGPAWALWMLVANTSLWLAGDSLILSGLVNLPMWALAERFRPRAGWPQVPLAVSWFCLTGSTWLKVLGESSRIAWALPAWVVWLAVTGGYAYRYRQKGVLAALGFSVVILLTTVLGMNLPGQDMGRLLVMGLAVIVQVTVLIQLLRRVPE